MCGSLDRRKVSGVDVYVALTTRPKRKRQVDCQQEASTSHYCRE